MCCPECKLIEFESQIFEVIEAHNFENGVIAPDIESNSTNCSAEISVNSALQLNTLISALQLNICELPSK